MREDPAAVGRTAPPRRGRLGAVVTALPIGLLLGLLMAGCGAVRGEPDGGRAQRAERVAPSRPVEGDAGRVRTEAVPDPSATVAATEVLRSWNDRRSAAYATGDLEALRDLYVPGSAAGVADVRLLRRYVDRGLTVEGMRTQILAVDVEARTPHRLRLRVVERLVGLEAVDRGRGLRRGLPRAGPTERVLDLTRSPGAGWRVLAVSR